MRKPTRRTCKVCKEKFTATFANVWWCCPEHGAIYALELRAKQKVKETAERIREQNEAEKEGRKRRSERRKAVKPLSHWVQMTQRAVNDWRRATLLSAGHGCISCGTKVAFVWHAGHYRTTAAAPQLRFNPDNIWLQCPSCNVHKSGNIEAYRSALVVLIGEARVQALESNNETHRYTREELDGIRADARAKLRAIKQQEAA
ncbi:recombination protein NinG [Enterobacter hormaechei]|uniref:recombination protein NinG n=1 Tax=Enterobacter hormaechei TaxID=158836 RepID=UPI000F683BBF|nr:recombination protein NinG [Enterobacter hormaechei]ELF1030710.1 recombination protein NinG [Enterobacter kobei]MBN4764750.1 recombination protein NinG [Enterobacter hormaechei]MCO7368095.1 recombination protein NinG [Enterobacter hormaechei]MDV5636807.1 recombination protein NinG [Enterobacter hormaechei]QXR29717.1 recombination protein NinG [Enterobacter hormaechei]